MTLWCVWQHCSELMHPKLCFWDLLVSCGPALGIKGLQKLPHCIGEVGVPYGVSLGWVLGGESTALCFSFPCLFAVLLSHPPFLLPWCRVPVPPAQPSNLETSPKCGVQEVPPGVALCTSSLALNDRALLCSVLRSCPYITC